MDEDTQFAELPTLVAGETDTVDFFSSSETRRASVGSRCVFKWSCSILHLIRSSSYYVAVHNKRTKTTTIREAPLHILTHQVKALKSLKPTPVSTLQRLEARAALGESFGTKKAKRAIKAQERNKVDVSAMETVADHLQESIQRNTQALPSRGTFPSIHGKDHGDRDTSNRGGASNGRQYALGASIQPRCRDPLRNLSFAQHHPRSGMEDPVTLGDHPS